MKGEGINILPYNSCIKVCPHYLMNTVNNTGFMSAFKNTKLYTFMKTVKFAKISRMAIRVLLIIAIIALILVYSFGQTREYKTRVYNSGLFSITPYDYFSEKHTIFTYDSDTSNPNFSDIEYLAEELSQTETSFADEYNYYRALDAYLDSLNANLTITSVTKNDLLQPDSNPFTTIERIIEAFDETEAYYKLLLTGSISLSQAADLFSKIKELSLTTATATLYNVRCTSDIDKILQAETMTLRTTALLGLSMTVILMVILFSSEVLFRMYIKNKLRYSGSRRSIRNVISSTEDGSHIKNKFIKNPKKLKENR